jgi:hypothetical protein
LVVELFAEGANEGEGGRIIDPQHPLLPPAPETDKLGTFLGVYIPTVEQMWGVIIFVRHVSGT